MIRCYRVDGVAHCAIDGVPVPHVVRHSPTGYEWGYGGSGPADLALSILTALGVPEAVAERWYQDFKWDFLAGLPREGGEVPVPTVRQWLRRHESIR
jgi:hypothetical protein